MKGDIKDDIGDNSSNKDKSKGNTTVGKIISNEDREV